MASACVPDGADFASRTPDSTCQPSAASVRATSRPMPRLAPVISAVAIYAATSFLSGLAVLLVRHLLHPLDHLAVQLFLDGEVRHRGRRRSAVPVLLVRRTPHDV